MARKRKKANSEKYQYSLSDIVFSPGWKTEEYRLADVQRRIDRSEKKLSDAVIFGNILDIIKENKFTSIYKLTNYIYLNYPELSPYLLQYYNQFRDYLRSLAHDELDAQIQKSYQDHLELKEKFQQLFEDYQIEMHDKIAFRESQIADLQWLIDQIEQQVNLPPLIIDDYRRLQKEWEQLAVSDVPLIDFDKIL